MLLGLVSAHEVAHQDAIVILINTMRENVTTKVTVFGMLRLLGRDVQPRL